MKYVVDDTEYFDTAEEAAEYMAIYDSDDEDEFDGIQGMRKDGS